MRADDGPVKCSRQDTKMDDSASSIAAKPAAVGRKTLWAGVVATFFGAGRCRPGPGTWGAAAACLLWFAASSFFPIREGQLSWLTLCAVIAVTAIGIPAATRVEQESGRHDPGYVVIDEVAGQWVALIHAHPNWSSLLLAFLLFRFFDILKPWPARRLERLPAGWGIVFDDLAAGLYALLVVQALQYWIGR